MYKRNKKTNLKTNLTNSYIWDSNLLHVGNFNSGGRVHSALTFRLTEKPVYYEPARLCTNTTSEDNFSENIEENYKKLLIQIINIIKFHEKLARHSDRLDLFHWPSLNPLGNSLRILLLAHLGAILAHLGVILVHLGRM